MVRQTVVPHASAEVVGDPAAVGASGGISQKQASLSPAGRVDAFLKRVFDILAASMMLVLFSPVMAFIAIRIMASNGGPIIYSHTRVGRDGDKFGCLKFRTMVNNADQVLADILENDPVKRQEWQLNRKLRDDPRIIAGIGHFLRNTSLDELPQIFNVLRGDMSIVGPRPVTEDELSKYGAFRLHYQAVKPGLTGPWQVGGRSDSSYEERVRQDVWYVENATFTTDLKIFASTALSFVTGRLSGAC